MSTHISVCQQVGGLIVIKMWGDCNTWGIFGGNGEGFKKSRTPCDVKQKEMGELVLPVYPVGNFL